MPWPSFGKSGAVRQVRQRGALFPGVPGRPSVRFDDHRTTPGRL